MLNSLIMFDLPCKNGILLGHGIISKETEKAVLVKYDQVPIFPSGVSSRLSSEYPHSMWVPKSVVVESKNGSYTIKKWFTMKLDQRASRAR
jgi:hypothetical protein